MMGLTESDELGQVPWDGPPPYQPPPMAGWLARLLFQMQQLEGCYCGTDVFSKRAVYWLAERYALKAGKVDASLKKTAAGTAANYRAKAPSKTDIFNNPEIKSVKIGCWIGETVKVPKL